MYQVADHLRARRFGFWHHGIFIGSNRVVHFTNVRGGKGDATIRIGTLAEFAAGGRVEVVAYPACSPPNEVLQRARVRLGESGYDLFQNNCEHFARWCKTGVHESQQVKTAGAAAAVFVAAAGAGVAAAWLVGEAGTPGCKATRRDGSKCPNRALSGNRGFCGVHRR